MITTSVTIEEFIPGDRYNAGTIQPVSYTHLTLPTKA